MALSALPVLRRRYPDAHVTWMTGKAFAPLVRQVREVDEVVEVNEKHLLAGRISQRILELFKVLRNLAWRKFDIILIAHSDKRYRILTMTVRGRIRRSFNWQEPFPGQGRHHCDEYVRLVTGVDGPQAELPQFPVVFGTRSDELFQRLTFTDGCPVIAIAPGGAKNVLREQALKRWPVEHYARLTKTLIERGIHVVVTGDMNDSWTRFYFGSLPVIDMIGKTSLLELIKVYRTVDLVVTHDSGSLHVAILAGTPVLSLFGPTMPQVFGPMGRHQATNNASGLSRVIWGGESLPCRPCYNGRSFPQCNNNVCMRSISPEEVMKHIEQMLKSEAGFT